MALRPGDTICLARAKAARDEHRGAHSEAEQERVCHEAEHCCIGERGNLPLPHKHAHDEHIHNLIGGLQQVGAERRQRKICKVSGRAAAQKVHFFHWVFLCAVETKKAAAAKPRPLGSDRVRITG